MVKTLLAGQGTAAATVDSPTKVRILPRLTFNFMARRKKPKQVLDTFQKFMTGEPVIVGRSLIWSGFSGEVVGFRNGLHVVKLNMKPGGRPCAPFHAELLGDELETHL